MMPSVPFEGQTRDGSPFTVWHVCAVCQQPRSARYHSEHPVGSGDFVPSHTVCRRCAASAGSVLAIAAPPSAPAISVQEPAKSLPSPEPAPVREIPFRHVPPRQPPAMPRQEASHRPVQSLPLRSHPPAEPSPLPRRTSQRYEFDQQARYVYEDPIDHRQSMPHQAPPPPQRPAPPYVPKPQQQNPIRPASVHREPTFTPPPRQLSREEFEQRSMPRSAPRQAPLANVKPRRVSFSGKDEVETLPPPLSESEERTIQGVSRMRLQSDHDGYEYEKRGNRPYINESDKPYIPEPNRALAHALSESPAREIPLTLEEEAELTASYAHGPYRAERSPTPSMEVHVDDDDFSKVSGRQGQRKRPPLPPNKVDAEKTWARQPPAPETYDKREWAERLPSKVDDERSYYRQAPPLSSPGKIDKDEREWTRYVTVKEYRDAQGPFIEVEEKIVFDK